MPGRFFLTGSQIILGPHKTARLVPRRNIKPGEALWALTADGFREMRWGLIPSGRVIVNARGETVFDKSAFAGVSRAAVPVSGWYEWTGQKGRKSIWEIAPKLKMTAPAILWFAAIWDVWQAPGGTEIAQLAVVTCPPNADVKDIHDRMGVLLAPGDVTTWLTADVAQARTLIAPAPKGPGAHRTRRFQKQRRQEQLLATKRHPFVIAFRGICEALIEFCEAAMAPKTLLSQRSQAMHSFSNEFASRLFSLLRKIKEGEAPKTSTSQQQTCFMRFAQG